MKKDDKRKSFVSRRFLSTFALLALIFSVSHVDAGPAFADDGECGNIKFNSFLMEGIPQTGDLAGMSMLKVSHGGKDLHQDSENMARTCSREKMPGNFPDKDCETLKVELFTGGANCCFGYYLLSTCPSGDSASYLPPFDGGVVSSYKPGVFVINDGTFMYYGSSVEGTGGNLDFNRVTSPRPQRLLVFENGAWRADKVAEFSDYYYAMADSLLYSDTEASETLAITKAYYLLMAGDSADAVYPIFKGLLPDGVDEKVTQKVFEDIKNAVNLFNPVENLALNK